MVLTLSLLGALAQFWDAALVVKRQLYLSMNSRCLISFRG